MKTSIDTPEKLLLRIRAHAIHDNKQLPDLVLRLLEKGMAGDSSFKDVEIPYQIKGGLQPTPEDIRRAIDMGRERESEKHDSE